MHTHPTDGLIGPANATVAQLIESLRIIHVGHHHVDLVARTGQPLGQTPGVTLRPAYRRQIGVR
jgi:hypothetical protein